MYILVISVQGKHSFISVSVFLHFLNILESKRMETTIPGELNEQ